MSTANADDVKVYRRELLLCCLNRIGAPSTAAEVAEYAFSLAAGDGHPRDAFSGLNPQMVAGILRGMEQAGTIQRGESRYDTSKGRDQPRWCVLNRDSRYPLPLPPDDDEPPQKEQRAEPRSPYDSLTRDQMIALLQVQDDIAAVAARLREAVSTSLAEMELIVASARSRLAAKGLGEA